MRFKTCDLAVYTPPPAAISLIRSFVIGSAVCFTVIEGGSPGSLQSVEVRWDAQQFAVLCIVREKLYNDVKYRCAFIQYEVRQLTARRT